MSKEAELLRRCVSCHDNHMCQKSRKSGRGGEGGNLVPRAVFNINNPGTGHEAVSLSPHFKRNLPVFENNQFLNIKRL